MARAEAIQVQMIDSKKFVTAIVKDYRRRHWDLSEKELPMS
jgi:hypothetical protein